MQITSNGYEVPSSSDVPDVPKDMVSLAEQLIIPGPQSATPRILGTPNGGTGNALGNIPYTRITKPDNVGPLYVWLIGPRNFSIEFPNSTQIGTTGYFVNATPNLRFVLTLPAGKVWATTSSSYNDDQVILEGIDDVNIFTQDATGNTPAVACNAAFVYDSAGVGSRNLPVNMKLRRMQQGAGIFNGTFTFRVTAASAMLITTNRITGNQIIEGED